MKIKGIAIPIAFPYSYRGAKVETLEVYFAYNSLAITEVDIFEGATSMEKGLAKILKYGEQKSPFNLIPLDPIVVGNYEAPHGMKFGITPIDSNPTTATMLDRIPFLPVKPENTPTLLTKFSSPFYLSVRDDGLELHVRKKGGDFYTVPCQPVSPKCSVGFAHDCIQLVEEKGNRAVMDFKKIHWPDLDFMS